MCRHPRWDRAYVNVNGRQIQLGKWGSEEAKRAYARFVDEWKAANDDVVTNYMVSDLVADWLDATKLDYGRSTNLNRRAAAQRLIDHAAHVPVAEFSPPDLRGIQRALVEAGELSRTHINRLIRTIRSCFRWGVGEGLVPASVWHGLQAIRAVRPGVVDDPPPVQPVDDALVDATLPHLKPIVAAMVRLQRVTGMRPAEVCGMTTAEIDRRQDVWFYRPSKHKTACHGRQREIVLGPRAIEIVAPLLRENDPDAALFSPLKSEQARLRARRAARQTPMTPSHRARLERSRMRLQQRAPGEFYDANSYRRAIHRACDRAGVERWSPNQLRHARATELRALNTGDGLIHALEVAQAVLGHARIETTQVYAARLRSVAVEAARRSG